LAVAATRATLRAGLADRVQAATDRELAAQMQLRPTADFREGVAAMAERRLPRFVGR
jgi:enoyl-CoA hydratase/carnithine racemase